MPIIPSVSVFGYRPFTHYWIMRQLVSAARQMQSVAIGWQVYELARMTHSIGQSALFLGLVGLAQFGPVLLLSLVGGQAADRLDRKRILIWTSLGRVLIALALLVNALLEPSWTMAFLFVAAALSGVMSAFSPAAGNSLFPRLVPRSALPEAIAWNSLGFQGATILGPAIAGLLFIWGGWLVYVACAAMNLAAMVAIATATTPGHIRVAGARGMRMIVEGLRYVRDNRLVLGVISLDLVVVLFGGVTALLPVFARDVLGVGATALGALRASPAVGALVVAVLLASRPLTRHIGRWLLLAIAVYGVAMLWFAFSTVVLVSMVALAVTGAADMISVYIRQSIIQLSTPDAMRGRVSSVSFVFISASNELGEFESGVAARFLGPVGAVILGGIIAIVSALSWFRLFPEVARADMISPQRH